MSVKAVKWAFAQKIGSPAGKAVLVALADHANDQGYCWPSFNSLAEHTELTRTAVRNWVAKLESAGFIEKEHRRAATGDLTSNKYRLRIGAAPTGNDVAQGVGNPLAHPGNQVAHQWATEWPTLGNGVAHRWATEWPTVGHGVAYVGNEVADPTPTESSASHASRGLQPDPASPNRNRTVNEPSDGTVRGRGRGAGAPVCALPHGGGAAPEPERNPAPERLRKREAARPAKTPLPADFGISDAVGDWATRKGFGDLDAHLEAFVLKCQAKGYQYVDWDAAFKTAIRDDWAGLRHEKTPAAGSRKPGRSSTAKQRYRDDATRERSSSRPVPGRPVVEDIPDPATLGAGY